MGDQPDFGHPSDLAIPREIPRFCPVCRQQGPDSGTLCLYCGETMRDRGFCGVCNAFWPLSPGEACPKHELPLDDAHSVAAEAHGDRVVEWATVARFGHPNEARAPAIRLEAEGIPTFIDGERMGDHLIYGVATGGVALKVPRSLAQDARVLLAQSWAPAVEGDDDLDDAWEELGPEPGALRRRVMKAFIVFFLLAPLLIALIGMVIG